MKASVYIFCSTLWSSNVAAWDEDIGVDGLWHPQGLFLHLSVPRQTMGGDMEHAICTEISLLFCGMNWPVLALWFNTSPRRKSGSTVEVERRPCLLRLA
jgi:hypothetical protein